MRIHSTVYWFTAVLTMALIATIVLASRAHAGPAVGQFNWGGSATTTNSPLPRIVLPEPPRPRPYVPKPRPDPRKEPGCAGVVELASPRNLGALHWGERLAEVNRSIACGDAVRFVDVCISGCTLWLRSPKACAVTGEVRFFFHAVHRPNGTVVPSETRELYRTFPARVRNVIDAHGGLRKDYFFVTADELGLRSCT